MFATSRILPFAALMAIALAGEKPLLDFGNHWKPEGVVAKEATYRILTEPAGPALEIRLSPGGAWAWPGVMVPVPPEGRDGSENSEILVDVENRGTDGEDLGIQVESTGGEAKKRRFVRKMALGSGERRLLHLIPSRIPKDGEPVVNLGHMVGLPPWATASNAEAVDMADLQRITFYVTRPLRPATFVIRKVLLSGKRPPIPAKPFPFVDTYGQYLHADWPGKIHSDGELAARTQAELSTIGRDPGPSDRNAWGGLASGPKLKATGFFRVEKVGNRWSLVDPDGGLFILHGMHGVRFGTPTPAENRDGWFQDFPGTLPEYKEMVSRGTVMVSSTYIPGQPISLFNFTAANLKRKYGEAWREKTVEMAVKRLRHWGMNTLGANGDPAFIAPKKMAYYFYADASSKARAIAGSAGYWGRFPDPLDPGFPGLVAAQVEKEVQAKGAAADPWCIGIGVDNELSWGAGHELALATLKSPPDQPAKKAFIEDLERKYGNIGALNAAWGAAHGSYEDLLRSTQVPDAVKAKVDLDAFFGRIADAYFSACSNAVKRAAPGHLYTGCRFMRPMPMAEKSAARFCDVVSFNYYHLSMAALTVAGGLDKPFLIGEFHFTAPGNGYFSPSGVVEVGSVAERAEAYRRYWGEVMRHPLCVGANWFMYGNQPVSGVWANGETYPCGFVDLVDQPDPLLTGVAREVGESMFRVRFGGK